MIDRWRNSLSGGISYIDEETNLIIQGYVDHALENIYTNELVADYNLQQLLKKKYYLN